METRAEIARVSPESRLAAIWRDRVENWRASGLTRSAYARKTPGVSPARLSEWIRRFDLEEAEGQHGPLTMVGQNAASGAHGGQDPRNAPQMEVCADQHRQQTILDHVAPATKAARDPVSHNTGPFVELSADPADQHKQQATLDQIAPTTKTVRNCASRNTGPFVEISSNPAGQHKQQTTLDQVAMATKAARSPAAHNAGPFVEISAPDDQHKQRTTLDQVAMATMAVRSPAAHNTGPFVEVSANPADQHKQQTTLDQIAPTTKTARNCASRNTGPFVEISANSIDQHKQQTTLDHVAPATKAARNPAAHNAGPFVEISASQSAQGQTAEPTDSSAENQRRTYWLEHVRAWRKSGLTQSVYAARAGIPYQSLARWSSRLGAATKETVQGEVPAQSATIIDVSALLSPPDPAIPSQAFRLCLRSGHCLEIPPHFSEQSLKAICNCLGVRS